MGDLRSSPETLPFTTTNSEIAVSNFSTDEEDKETENGSKVNRRIPFLQRLNAIITNNLENFFFRWGFTVATHPYKFITICLLFVVICATGFYNFHQEIRPDKLILPESSEYAFNTDWLRFNSPVPVRDSHAILRAPNVLVPEVMKILLNLHNKIKNLATVEGKRWEDVCFRLPITKFDSQRRRKRSLKEENPSFGDSFEDAFSDDFFGSENEIPIDNLLPKSSNPDWDPYANIPEELYCSILENLDDGCWESNPVEFWEFNQTKVDNLTQNDVIWFFNHQLESPVFGRHVNFTRVLGGNIVRNEKGEIISAESILLRWAAAVDKTSELVSDEQGQLANPDSLKWEKLWIDAMAEFSSSLPQDIKLYYFNSRSWGDISQATLQEEGITLAFGYAIMFIYVGMNLGKLNMVEQRPYLTGAGLIAILLSLIVACGISSSLSIPFMTLNRILPFLLLGIGIDDMFVIMQMWNNLFPSPLQRKSKLTIEERMGYAMRHAGVSVLVTSLTDVAAFTAGSLTTIPSLRSFCIYAAIGILALFVFQSTFFVACFAIDQRRLEERRNAYFFCIKYPESKFKSSNSSSKSYSQLFFDKILAKYLLKKPSKIAVILLTGAFLGIGIFGNTKLRQKFDPMWFLPDDSYMAQLVSAKIDLYPKLGIPAMLVAHEVNWSASHNQFGTFMDEFKTSEYVYGIDEWYGGFKTFSKKYYSLDVTSKTLTPQKFDKYLGKYLYSPNGAKYRYFFSSNESFSCGESVPHITTVIIPFVFEHFDGFEQHLPALRWIKSLTKKANFTFNNNADGKFFYWGTAPLAWEIDEIIKEELYRNLALSITCVLLATLLLLADWKLSLLCGCCVILTIINVSGVMHFWGLTIESASCTLLVLSVGLSVDYASHICLAFMKSQGSKTQRAEEAVKSIGPAVLNGGFSTFLGVILLANAQTHVVGSFFKIFTLVVFFGLFHGLIFLPVLLSLVGSEPYPHNDEGQHKEKKTDVDNLRVVELYPLCNGNNGIHVKEIEALSQNNDRETSGMLKDENV